MKATVLLITYNHTSYIGQAVESVLAQETDFDFEILISDDCSTDGTREIICDYARRHPDKIRLRLNEINKNSNEDFDEALQAADGDYVAFLEGDDYWTSPLKLKQVVDFMDSHPPCNLVWHDMDLVNERGQVIGTSEQPISKNEFTLVDFFSNCPISTLGAVLIRSTSVRPRLPNWYFTNPVGDYPLWLASVRTGYAYHLEGRLGAYRIHDKGFWGRLNNLEKAEVAMLTYRDLFLKVKDDWRVHMVLPMARYWEAYALEFKIAGNLRKCKETAQCGLADCPNNIRLLLLSYAPQAWSIVRRIFKFTKKLSSPQARWMMQLRRTSN